jgi:signal transduction histidine kinase
MIRRYADLLLAPALAAAAVAQALVWPIADEPVGVLVALWATLPVAWRRSHPLAAAVVGTLVWFVPTDGHLAAGYVATFVLFYSLAAYVREPEPVVAVTAFGIGAVVTSAWIEHEVPEAYLGALGAVLLPAVVGRLARHQHEQAQRLEELSGELEREREQTAQMVAGEERERVARELHEVVADALNGIVHQAGAALEADPEAAAGALRAIRRSAEEALGELQLLGEQRGAVEPRPGLAQLPGLVERARAAGMPVTLHVDGRPRAVSAGVDLSAFRIVQEALRNAHRHARGAPATVHISWERRELCLQVRDVGVSTRVATAGDGHGIVAMRERVRLHGGELRAGRLPGGGFEVKAVLPLTTADDSRP